MEITLYTIHCPKCTILQKKLDASGLEYNTIEDVDKVVEKGREVHITSAPFLVVDGEAMDYKHAVDYINNIGK